MFFIVSSETGMLGYLFENIGKNAKILLGALAILCSFKIIFVFVRVRWDVVGTLGRSSVKPAAKLERNRTGRGAPVGTPPRGHLETIETYQGTNFREVFAGVGSCTYVRRVVFARPWWPTTCAICDGFEPATSWGMARDVAVDYDITQQQDLLLSYNISSRPTAVLRIISHLWWYSSIRHTQQQQ